MVSTASWNMSEYTLPADFGTVTEIQTDCSAFVSLDSVKVDCEYNYKAIEEIKGGSGGSASGVPGYVWSDTWDETAIAMYVTNIYIDVPSTVFAYRVNANGMKIAEGNLICVDSISDPSQIFWWVYYIKSTVSDFETLDAYPIGVMSTKKITGDDYTSYLTLNSQSMPDGSTFEGHYLVKEK